MRLIDADALIDDLMERYCKECDKRKGIKSGERRIIYEIGEVPCRACEVDDVKAELEEAPTVDVPDRNVGKWDMFDLITSAYYGKMMYSKQDNGIVYSRYSCKYMSMDEAIMEFLALIGEDIE